MHNLSARMNHTAYNALRSVPSRTPVQVISVLRDALHFVTPSDPRLEEPDLRQKGRAGARTCEQAVMDALSKALPGSDTACDAAVKAVAALRGKLSPHRRMTMCLLGVP